MKQQNATFGKTQRPNEVSSSFETGYHMTASGLPGFSLSELSVEVSEDIFIFLSAIQQII
jgi:hypothetical protein